MATNLGMNDTTLWAGGNERPQDWLQMVFLLFTNGDVPFTALFGQLPNTTGSDIRANWFESSEQTLEIQANGAHTAGDTTIDFHETDGSTEASPILKNGMEHQDSGELLLVTGEASAGPVTVVRSWGSVGAASIDDNDLFTIQTNSHAEGTGAPTGTYQDLDEYYNVHQIFKEAYEMTRSAAQTHLRSFAGGAWGEHRRQALERLSSHVEQALIFGERVETTLGGRPQRGMRGVIEQINTVASGNITNNDSLGTGRGTAQAYDAGSFNTFLRTLFTFGGDERLVLCGNQFATFLQEYGDNRIVENTIGNETVGIRVATVQTYWGKIHIKTHPLFTRHTLRNSWGLFLDFSSGKDRITLQPLKNHENVQDRDVDARKDMFLGEFTARWINAKTDGLIRGVSGLA